MKIELYDSLTYIHGFRSSFDKTKPKVQILSQIGRVDGPQIDYEADTLTQIEEKICSYSSADFLVGTSMGGWMAAHHGIKYGLPFVAINPVTDPQNQFVGKHLKQADDYYPFPTEGERCGLILLDEGDEVFDSRTTHERLEKAYRVEMFPQGTHRFEHMQDALKSIKRFLECDTLCYGLTPE